MSDRLTLEIHNRHAEPQVAARYGIDKAPALVLEGPAGARVRFYGVPAGLEFTSLLQALADAASGAALLSAGTWKKLAGLTRPVHLQVFVTPTCPFCPPAVRTAHKLATASPLITADMIESTEFPVQAEHYGVRGVPHVVVNEHAAFDGADDEASFVDAVLAAVAAEPASVAA
jgi:glutaredoxin-like protein